MSHDDQIAQALAVGEARQRVLDSIVAADDLVTETVDVPEWGVTLTLRTPTLLERARMVARFVDGDAPTTDLSEMYPALLIATCVDPDTGGPLFTEADADLIRSKNGTVVERVAQVALRMAGMSDDSVPTPSGASSSTLNASTAIV